MDECIHLIGRFLDHFYKYDPLKHVQMLNMSKRAFYCSNSWTCMVQVPVLGKLCSPAKKNFGKPKTPLMPNMKVDYSVSTGEMRAQQKCEFTLFL